MLVLNRLKLPSNLARGMAKKDRTPLVQIVQILQTVCKKEGLNLPTELAQRIAEKSQGNLRRAILMCEACKVQQ